MRRTILVLAFLFCASATRADGPEHSVPVPHQSAPEEKTDPCSFEGITDHCRIFEKGKPNNERLAVGNDGTFIPNFPAIIAGKPLSSFADYREKIEQDRALKQKQFAFQRDLHQALARIPASLMHPDFKIYLRDPQKILDLADLVRQIDEKKKKESREEGEGAPPPQILLWWPPERPLPEGAPEERLVQAEEAQEKLKKIFPTKQAREDFLKIADQAEALADQAAQAAASDNRSRLRANHRLSEKPGVPDRPGLAANPTLKALARVSAARLERVKNLFEFARTTLIELITKGRREDTLSDAERAAIAKISSVVFVNDPDDPKAKAGCIGSIPDAFYNQEDHSVTLCRNYYNFPDAELVSTFGHELFHAIDPCNVQFPTFEINREAFGKLIDPALNLPIQAIRDDDERFVVYQKLGSALQRTGMATPEIETYASDTTAEYFTRGDEKIRLLHRVADGTPFNPDPKKSLYLFRNVYACLQNPERGGFRPESKEEIRQLAHKVAQDRLRAHARDPGYDPRRDEEALIKAYERFPECLDQENRSQMCEAMADWAGAKVLGKFLEGKSLKTPEEKLTAMAFFADVACLRRASAKQKGQDTSATGLVRAAQATLEQIRDEHPDPARRIDAILLRERNIAKSVCGTEPKGKSCEEGEKR